MKRILTVILALTVACIISGSSVFADEDKPEVQLKELKVDQMQGNVEFGEQYPLSDYLTLKLSDGSEAKILTDGTIKTVIALDEDGDEYEIEWLNCELSTAVKRDEVLNLSLTDKAQINDFDNVEYHLYKVANDAIDDSVLFKNQLPVANNYVMDFKVHVDDDHSNPYNYFRDITSYVDNEKKDLYIQFTYGVEEKEVMAMIEALPDAANVKRSDEAAIKEARAAYDALEKWKTTEPADPQIQEKVTNYSKLVDVEAALANAPEETPDTPVPEKVTKKNQPMSAAAKTIKVTQKKLKKKSIVVKAKKAFTIKNAQGTVTYKLKKAPKKAKNKIRIAKNGKVTLKKGLKKGTYKVKVSITAKGNAKYKAGTKVITLKIIVK